MKWLIGCESSGTVRDAIIAAGHEATSCDLLPTSKPGPHYQGDIFDVIDDGWDGLIVHPPCTFLSSSGLHWNTRRPGRAEQTLAALDFVRRLLAAKIPKICLENPVGRIGTQVQKASQTIQPYHFGEDASKRTCLWLKNLPPLRPTRFVEGRIVVLADGREVMRWANQTDSGQNRLPPSEDRWKLRSETYPGIAQAMASQWCSL